MSKRLKTATFELGDGVGVIRRDNSSTPVLAGVLGVDRDAEGMPKKVYLDRVVHEDGDSFSGWEAHGAFATVMSKT